MTQKIWLPKNVRTAFSIENKESVKPKRKSRQGQIQETRICATCEMPFLASYPNQFYCENCRAEYRKKKIEEITKPRQCKKCGNYFTPTPKPNSNPKLTGSYNRTICRECARKTLNHCLNCGKRIFKAGTKFCSNGCILDYTLNYYQQRKQELRKRRESFDREDS